MRNLLALLVIMLAYSVNAQVETIPTITGSNSGDGEIKAIVAAAQSNDDGLQVEVDINKTSFQDSLGYFIVDHPGDSTDASTEIQTQIDAAYNDGGGIVKLKGGIYVIDDTLNIRSNVSLEGSGYDTRLDGSTQMFQISDTRADRWTLKDFRFKQNDGAFIKIENIGKYGRIENVRGKQYDTGEPVIMVTGENIYLQNLITGCYFEVAEGSTESIIVWDGWNGGLNMNIIENTEFEMNLNTAAPAILLTDSTNQYCYGNAFRDLTFEGPLGGAIHLLSCNGSRVDNCWVYDLTGNSLSDHLFYMDRTDGSSTPSINNIFTNSGRVGAVTMNGKADFNLSSFSQKTMLIGCSESGNGQLAITSGNNTNMIFGNENVVTSGTVGTQIGTIDGVKFYQLTAALTDGSPTHAEIDAATGTTPSAVDPGWAITIKDSDGSGLLYRVESDGTDWYYTTGTKAL